MAGPEEEDETERAVKRRALCSREVFRKPGPKREANCMPEQSTELTPDARRELEARLAKVDAALQMPHSASGKSLIVARWDSSRRLARVLQRRGNHLNHFGHGQAGSVCPLVLLMSAQHAGSTLLCTQSL